MKNGSQKRSHKSENNFLTLRKIYDLPSINHTEEVDSDFYSHIRRRHYFLLIVAFDQAGRVVLLRDFGKRYGWELLGGSISPNLINDYQEVAQELVQKEIGASLFNVEPIAFVDNHFSHKGLVVTHHGLALVARLNGAVQAQGDIEWGFFKELPSSMFAANKGVAKLAIEALRKKDYVPPINEVTASASISVRHAIHKTFVSSTVGKIASNQLKQAVLTAIGRQARSFLDTSCGDDELPIIVSEQNKGAFIVCNDISVKNLHYLKRISKKKCKYSQFVFTNHDLLDLPMKYQFDVVLSKNTLHHLASRGDVVRAISILKRLGRKIVIVDIEDPTRSSISAWIWHMYYVWFLRDQGHHFLTFSALRDILLGCFDKREFKIQRIRTVRGTYLIAVITPHSPS